MAGQEKSPNTMKEETPQLTEREVLLMIEGSIKSLIDDKDYFYSSAVGPAYSKLTPKGEEMIVKVANQLFPLLSKARENEMDERARALVFSTLKEQYDQ